jgi:RNA polymerase sigma-70 factor (ECF subfamily)
VEELAFLHRPASPFRRNLIMKRPDHEQILLNAAQGGSREALGQLLQAYRPLLLMLAREEMAPGLRAKGGASDLVQETCIDAVKGLGDFAGHTPAEFRHWLEQMIRHNACDFNRHFQDTGKRQVSRERRLCRPGLVPSETGPVSGLTSPLAQLLQEERARVLRQALARLPEADRLVLLLRHRDHLPFDQIARRLGCAPAAVRQRWVRAVAQWRRTVEEAYGPP